jgi:hypothetical protein
MASSADSSPSPLPSFPRVGTTPAPFPRPLPRFPRVSYRSLLSCPEPLRLGAPSLLLPRRNNLGVEALWLAFNSWWPGGLRCLVAGRHLRRTIAQLAHADEGEASCDPVALVLPLPVPLAFVLASPLASLAASSRLSCSISSAVRNRPPLPRGREQA